MLLDDAAYYLSYIDSHRPPTIWLRYFTQQMRSAYEVAAWIADQKDEELDPT